MKAPKCKICQKEHYGPCYVRDDQGLAERDYVSPTASIKPAVHERVALRPAQDDAASSQPISRPKLETPKARASEGEASSVSPGARKVGRPKTDTGPQFDKREYQRQYMVAYRAKLKANGTSH